MSGFPDISIISFANTSLMITRSLGEKKQIFSAFTDVLAMYELMMLKQKKYANSNHFQINSCCNRACMFIEFDSV